MDTETVVAVGFVIHELLGLVGGLILCYFGYRLLMRRVKAQPREMQGTWNLAKRFMKNAAPGTLFALFGAVAIWLTASNALTPKTFASKNSADFAMPPAKGGRTSTPAENERAITLTLGPAMPAMNQAHSGNSTESTEDNLKISQSPAPTPAPVATPETGMRVDRNALAKNTQLPEAESGAAGSRIVESERQKAARKTLEKERRAAERKRSRLEEMYQSHLISSEAYKKGEEEYKSEIERYRSEMAAHRS
jgi:hypothetical protein